AMHISRPRGAQRIVQAVQDLHHVLALLRQAVIADGLAQILDVKRKRLIVGIDLAGMSEVEETLDAGGKELAHALARGIRGQTGGMLAREEQARDRPV